MSQGCGVSRCSWTSWPIGVVESAHLALGRYGRPHPKPWREESADAGAWVGMPCRARDDRGQKQVKGSQLIVGTKCLGCMSLAHPQPKCGIIQLDLGWTHANRCVYRITSIPQETAMRA